jgi:hypothetical protein
MGRRKQRGLNTMVRKFTKYPSSIKASDDVPYDAEGLLPPDAAEFVTDEGKSTIAMFKKYGLLDYYDPMVGNASIPAKDFESVKNNIMRLIKENEGWVLGFGQEASGYVEDFWYITEWLE